MFGLLANAPKLKTLKNEFSLIDRSDRVSGLTWLASHGMNEAIDIAQKYNNRLCEVNDVMRILPLPIHHQIIHHFV